MGPYYAMFPSTFADHVVKTYSDVGDTVLDPFAGRGTSLFSAAVAGRRAIGVELNPVGWIYSATKLNPAPKELVINRIKEIEGLADRNRLDSCLPVFFQYCYSDEVRAFLLCARKHLDWRNNNVDRTAMAFLLVHLHGKASDSLSNQMRQTKAMSPQYAINWWIARELKPPNVIPANFFEKKVNWRYAKGVLRVSENLVLLGDSSCVLEDLADKHTQKGIRKASLMITSPPYFDVTNYHYDQWIRLWLLGGPPTDRRTATTFNGRHQGKFSNIGVYESLLNSVFYSSAKLMREKAAIYVRTDRREPTISITRNALKRAFPDHTLKRINRPLREQSQTQTGLFGHHAPRLGEVDFILQP